MKAIEWMAAMLWGASIGAAAALLWTPYDGKHMRRMVCKMWKKSGAPCCCEECDCTAHDAECDKNTDMCESPSV
ncbi:MAG: YtxH domain-containing protein [Bacteroidaceae bacterium]|nr:YtxH domain-containing protein [Bacteroidaceae bacterium]